MGKAIYDYIQQYLSKEIYPFHMPGHKRNKAFLPRDLVSLDVTEIEGMDNLHAPEGIIRDMQAHLATLYGADESFFLVNGATAGLVAAICAVCDDHDTLAVARNCHSSVYHGMALAGACPAYILPEQAVGGLSGGVLSGRLPRDAKAVIVTSPTYEGFTSDIRALADEAHRQGTVLIVDEAHGAHFPFHPAFPANALSLGADLVVNSFHKTLPALSQCAVLHVQGTRVDRARLRYFLKATQTSSPSYLLMSATDYMLRHLADNPDLFSSYVSRLRAFRNEMGAPDAPVSLLGRELVGSAGVCDVDIGKILFHNRSAISSTDMARRLAARYGVQVEMAYGSYILAMTSVADTEEGFTRLSQAIQDVNSRLKLDSAISAKAPAWRPWPDVEVLLPPREAVRRPTQTVDWNQAIGCVSGAFITPYPPGISLLAPGERITKAVKEAADAWGLALDSVQIIKRS